MFFFVVKPSVFNQARLVSSHWRWGAILLMITFQRWQPGPYPVLKLVKRLGEDLRTFQRICSERFLREMV